MTATREAHKMTNNSPQNAFTRMASLPTMQLFSSTYCNLACPYCSQGDVRKSRAEEDMLNTPHVLASLKSWPDTHFYISGGEPLIHDGVLDFLRVTSNLNHVISFDTNGVVPEKRLRRIIESLPPEKFGFFNISHHILAGVSLDTVQRTCAVLREASIPHFVKYIGTPEIIPLIRKNMNAVRDSGTGVAVTILETYAKPWNGRNFPREYTTREMIALLNMVTLGTHAMQFFGGIQSNGHPCLAGSTYVAYNMKNRNELISCCHSPKHIDWNTTVFADATPTARPCGTTKCLGDLMFILGLQGLGNEMDRFEQVCKGNSPALGIEAALAHVQSIADHARLVDHERFTAFRNSCHSSAGSFSTQRPSSQPHQETDDSLHPSSSRGRTKLTEYYRHFRQILTTEVNLQGKHTSYYYDGIRWPGPDALRNFTKHKAARAVGLPLKFNVEVTTQCVFKCEFCVLHSGRLAKKRSQLFLSYNDFARLFLQIQPFTTHIEFTGGEPLLNKDLSRMIALCNEAKIKTTVATNAKLLTAANVEKLLADAPSTLLIAYESGQVEAYEHHRIGGNLEVLEHNIKGFISERDQRGLSYPRVQLQTVVSRETVAHMDSFWRDAQLLDVDEACSKPIFIWPDGDDAYWELMRRKYLIPDHPLSYYQTDAEGKLRETGIQGYCPNTENVHLGADGSVVPCWYNLLSSPQLGNALQTPFVDIWFSDAYEDFRTAMKNHTAYTHGCRYCIGIHKPELFQRKTFRQAEAT